MSAISLFKGFFTTPECAVKAELGRCLRNRLRGNGCDLCLQSCPSRALCYQDSALRLDTEKCSGCLRCTALCPNDALMPHADPKFHDVLRRRKNSEFLLISCERQRLFRDEEIVVPCLAVFSHELLLFLLTFSAAQTVRFNISGCKSCGNEEPCREFQRDLKCVQQRSGHHRLPNLDFLTQEKSENERDSRRSFLKSLGAGALQATSSSIGKEPAQPEISANSRTIPRKIRLLKEIRDADKMSHPLAIAMIPQVRISDDCTPCPRCAGICPTGALSMVNDGGGKELSFTGERCSGCALCVEFCHRSALSLYCYYS